MRQLDAVSEQTKRAARGEKSLSSVSYDSVYPGSAPVGGVTGAPTGVVKSPSKCHPTVEKAPALRFDPEGWGFLSSKGGLEPVEFVGSHLEQLTCPL